jgi:hypothetical protein
MSTKPRGAVPWGKIFTGIFKVARRARGFFPLTFTGLILLGLSAAAFWLEGIRRQDFVFLAIGFIGVLVTLLVLLLTVAAAPLVHARWKRGSTRPGLTVECAAVQETGFFPPLPRWLPLLEYSWKWEPPAYVDVRDGTHPDRRREFVVPRRRGVHSGIRRRILLRDVLGLTALEWVIPESAEIRFLPAKGALDTLTLLDGLTGGDDLSDPRGAAEGDRVDMRQYTPGDSPRMILWKVYAHTRKLLVRVPERALTARPRFCAYFVAGTQDEPGAGFTRVVLERGFLGENWRFGADGSTTFTGRLDEAIDLLIGSASVSTEAATRLPEFLQQAEKDGFASCLVVMPPTQGPWVDPVFQSLCHSALRIHAFTVVDGPARVHAAGQAWKRLFYTHHAHPGESVPDLAWMAHDFGAVPFPISALDRVSGRAFGDARSLGMRKRAAQAVQP